MPKKIPKRKLKNWLKSYIEWTSKSEPPEDFHFWCGVSALSTALGRGVKLDRGHYTLYPNTYIVLIAGSSKCRKSTAVRMSRMMIRDLELRNKIKVVKNSITPEEFIRVMGEEAIVSLPDSSDMLVEKGSEALLFAPELTTLINEKAFHNDFVTDLTDLFDCPDDWERNTKMSGNDRLVNVFVNILGATTPKELADKMPQGVIGSGFTSRICFIYKKATDRSFPHPEDFYRLPEMQKLKKDLIHDIAIINTFKGEFQWGPGARDHFTDWYDNLEQAVDPNMDGYRGRMHDHAIKLAMIMSVSTSNDLIITEDILKAAIFMIGQLESSVEGVYAILTQAGTTAGDIAWIGKMLKYNGGSMSHSDLLRKAWRRFTATSLKDTISMMREANMVKVDMELSYNKMVYTLIENPEVIKMIFDEET